MKIMLLGDTHGESRAYVKALDACVEQGIKHVFQLGDCGLFPRFLDTIESIDTVQAKSKEHDIHNYWVRGNHDDPDAWQSTIDHWPGKHRWGNLRTHIHLLPRVHYMKMFGLDILSVGGAVSIDREWRINQEAHSTYGHKTLWWPNESISDEDLAKVTAQKVDLFLTHDCSNHTPFYGRLKPDLDSQINRQKVDVILRRAKPDYHFHGHMHTQYQWVNDMSSGYQHDTITCGLECNENAMDSGVAKNNWIIFDTETKHITWKDGDTHNYEG